jgi:hypothetical protein
VSTLKQATKAILEYQRTYRHPDRPPFLISERYILFPAASSPKPAWPDTWPHTNHPGVYLMLDDADAVLYVGKASANSCLGLRLGAYFRYDTDGQRCKFVYPDWCPSFVVNVAVPSDSPFEAPALEEFLIKELAPPRNKAGVRPRGA